MAKERPGNYEKIISSLTFNAIKALDFVASVSCVPGVIGHSSTWNKKSDRSIVTNLIDAKSLAVVITISVNLIYDSSKNIPEQVLKIQETIKNTVENSTEYTVKYINVTVAGVVFN